jgi:hypothetical protein
MQEILRIYSKITKRKGSSITKEETSFYNYFIVPFSAGIYGFAGFLFILIAMDFTMYLVGISSSLEIGLKELSIAAIGFVLQFTYQLIKNVK